MSAHTPGPWSADGNEVTATVVSERLGRGHVRIAATCGEWCVGVKHFPDGVSVGLENEEMAANARLIAAAPDLLEALETLMGYATKADSKAVQKARAALKKARDE